MLSPLPWYVWKLPTVRKRQREKKQPDPCDRARPNQLPPLTKKWSKMTVKSTEGPQPPQNSIKSREKAAEGQQTCPGGSIDPGEETFAGVSAQWPPPKSAKPTQETIGTLPEVNWSLEAANPIESTHKPEYLNLRLREMQRKGGTRLDIPDRPNSSWLANSTEPNWSTSFVIPQFKTELLAYNNAYCSWLLQATLSRLSFWTNLLQWLKGAMQISVIGHPLAVPFQALQGYVMTRVAGSFRFQTARGPWPGAMA